MPKIEFSRQAEKFQRTLPGKHKRQIAAKIMQLHAEPFPQDAELLKGMPFAIHRVTVGEYRIIYHFLEDKETLYIRIIGHRNDSEAYRLLKRSL